MSENLLVLFRKTGALLDGHFVLRARLLRRKGDRPAIGCEVWMLGLHRLARRLWPPPVRAIPDLTVLIPAWDACGHLDISLAYYAAVLKLCACITTPRSARPSASS